jgi:hypothetical protein
MPALQAQAKVDPSVVHFKAFFAAFAAGLHFFKVFLMSTGLSHESPQDFFM